MSKVHSVWVVVMEMVLGWDYNDFGAWNDIGECGANFQSGLNIPLHLQSECGLNDDLQLKWGLDTTKDTFMVKNSKYSLTVVPVINSIENNVTTTTFLNTNENSIGNLTNIHSFKYTTGQDRHYCLDSFHFHWGTRNSVGSEHTLNALASPLELHFVHYSCDYDNLTHALMSYINGDTNENKYVLAVVGVLFDIGESNTGIEQIVSDQVINQIKYYNSSATTWVETNLDLTDLIPFEHNFIGYHGSLTTPPCYETVLWHVMTHKMTVSEAQLNKFRQLYAGDQNTHEIGDNWRPVQMLNGRKLYACSSHLNEEIDQDTESDEADGLKRTNIAVILSSLALAISVLVCAGLLIHCICVPKLCPNDTHNNHDAIPVDDGAASDPIKIEINDTTADMPNITK